MTSQQSGQPGHGGIQHGGTQHAGIQQCGIQHDLIQLTAIRGHGYHGVLDFEREQGQEFSVDVTMQLDTRPAAAHDDLELTVNYADVCAEVSAVITGQPFRLIESLAEKIAQVVLRHGLVQAVTVTVHKPQAPVAVPCADIAVQIVRDRQHGPAVQPRPEVQHRPDAQHSPEAQPRSAVQHGPTGGITALASAASVLVSPEHPVQDRVPTDVLDQSPDHPVDVVLALGGNVGEVQATLRAAIVDIGSTPDIELVDVAPLARTRAHLAQGQEAQADYLNTVLIVSTLLPPRALLRAVQAIENRYGRTRSQVWGPRTLDVDIITYGSLIAMAQDLELPHPRAHERAFVLVPWAQIRPQAQLPGLGGGPVAALAATAPDRDGIRWMALDWLDSDHLDSDHSGRGNADGGSSPSGSSFSGGAPSGSMGSNSTDMAQDTAVDPLAWPAVKADKAAKASMGTGG